MRNMKRTHRLLLVLNFAVSFQDEDNIVYMEYAQLKKYLSRKELLSVYNGLKQGERQFVFSNPVIHSIVGV